MDKKEIISKKIDIILNAKNNLWFAAIASITGTTTLAFNPDTKLKIILLFIGSLLSIGFVYGYFKKDDQLEMLINKSIKESYR